jgi:molybdenum cofactor biosynthesis enzyme MoaA
MTAPIPLTLVEAPPADRWRRELTDLRISVVDRCNFRCPYCLPEDQYPEHHAFLDKRARLSFEEIERLARMFAGLGVRKIRLTGGEPLLRRELPLLVSWLARNDAGVIDLVARFRGTPHVPRFIEYMDVGTLNGWQRERVVPTAELVARIDARWPLEPLARSAQHDVAERYRFTDGGGEIGFISSVSSPFCGDCTRARLSADGKLYTCLFASEGYDLRALLRDGASDADIAAAITQRWRARDDRYSERRAELRAGGADARVEMFAIGG